jgi:hypothetical protein
MRPPRGLLGSELGHADPGARFRSARALFAAPHRGVNVVQEGEPAVPSGVFWAPIARTGNAGLTTVASGETCFPCRCCRFEAIDALFIKHFRPRIRAPLRSQRGVGKTRTFTGFETRNARCSTQDDSFGTKKRATATDVYLADPPAAPHRVHAPNAGHVRSTANARPVTSLVTTS